MNGKWQQEAIAAGAAIMLPFEFTDSETGDKVSLRVSPEYAIFTVNKREYYFVRETGQFDGTGSPVGKPGPILIYVRE